jgi:D-alanyl-D-alanine carboxypeptidase (penicillin-binding protein 5/6)
MLHSASQRIIAVALIASAVLLAVTFGVLRADAASAPVNVGTTAKAAILLDADTGAILFQHNADELLPPASITKLMTVEVVFQAIKAGRLKLEDPITMSVHAWRTGGAPSRTSSMFVPVHQTATVDELLQGMLVQSANDAAIAIAEGMAGSEEAFAKRMMVEAKRIGLTKSVFKNPSGLYDAEHLMTAREIAMLARYFVKELPEYYPRFGQKEFQYQKFKFRNRNPLLFEDIGVDGLKTGSLTEAGFNIVASAVQNGKRLIVVVLGMPSAPQVAAEAKRLLQWGYNGFAQFKLFEAGETVGKARVWGGNVFYVPLTGGDGPVTILLPRVPPNPRLKAEIIYEGPLKPPIKKGEQVARLRVTSQTNSVNEVPLYAAQDVEPGGLMRRGLDSLAHLAFGWVAL